MIDSENDKHYSKPQTRVGLKRRVWTLEDQQELVALEETPRLTDQRLAMRTASFTESLPCPM